jgi:DNA-binding MarR family transcriptional regulator
VEQDDQAVDPEPRWLDDREMRSWRAFVEVVNLVTRALDRELRTDSDLTNDDYELLVALSEAPEQRIRLGELAAGLRVPKAHLTYRIARMEKAGLVERVDCPTDARGVLAVLTDVGMQRLERAAPGHVASVRRHVLDHLDTEQLAALGDAMEAILRGHDAAPCPPGGCDEPD